MKEKDIVYDILSGTKASISSYTTAITECSNPQLRSTLQTLRNEAETAQNQLYQIASQKGYYVQPPVADQNSINQVKSDLTATANFGNTNMK